MKKYYIKELDNTSGAEWFFDDAMDDVVNNHAESVFIGGNRAYKEYNYNLIRTLAADILGAADSYELEFTYKNNMCSLIIDYIKPYKKISLKAAIRINQAVHAFYDDTRSMHGFICDALAAIFNKRYSMTQFRGYCQGDWTFCYYCVDEITHDYLDYLDAVYWGTGVMLEVHDDDNTPASADDIAGFVEYIADGLLDDKKRRAADLLGCDPCDIVYYEIKEIKEIKYNKIIYGEAA